MQIFTQICFELQIYDPLGLAKKETYKKFSEICLNTDKITDLCKKMKKISDICINIQQISDICEALHIYVPHHILHLKK